MTFVEYMRLSRAIAGKTQRQVAAEIGVDPASVYGWERGGVIPQAFRIPALARALCASRECLADLYNAEVVRRNNAIIFGTEEKEAGGDNAEQNY